MTKLLSRLRRKHPGLDVLSACADASAGAPAPGVATHIAACDECREHIEELRGIRAVLRSMPSADVPRSFRLRPADVETRAPARTPSLGAGALRVMPAVAGLAVVLFAVLVGVDLFSNNDHNTQSPTARVSNAPTAAQSDSLAAAPASPQAATKSEADATGTQAPEAPAAGAVAAPSGSPRVTDIAPSDANAGTLASPPASSSQTAPAYAAAQTAQPPRAPEFRDTHVVPASDGDGWSGLRIAEAVVAGLAIVTGGIAAVRWFATSREV